MPLASGLLVDSDAATRERIANELREIGHDEEYELTHGNVVGNEAI